MYCGAHYALKHCSKWALQNKMCVGRVCHSLSLQHVPCTIWALALQSIAACLLLKNKMCVWSVCHSLCGKWNMFQVPFKPIHFRALQPLYSSRTKCVGKCLSLYVASAACSMYHLSPYTLLLKNKMCVGSICCSLCHQLKWLWTAGCCPLFFLEACLFLGAGVDQCFSQSPQGKEISEKFSVGMLWVVLFVWPLPLLWALPAVV